MLKALLAEWKLAALGVVTALVLLAIGGAYVKGRADASAAATIAAKNELIDQLNERGKIDGTVEKMPAADLCLQLGGMWRDGICE